MAEEKKKENPILVVSELPTQKVNLVTDEAGKEFSLMTVEQALTELVSNVREIKKVMK